MASYIPFSQGIRFQMGGGSSVRLIGPESGAEQITMNHSTFQPGHEFPQHIHDLSADIFIVLVGGVSVRQGDTYTPIRAGDYAYIPAGEVHGTVNQTDEQAILISFQSPPDPSLYKGERDPAVTGSVPRPPDDHTSTVQIRQLRSGMCKQRDGSVVWKTASPEMGSKEMVLWYVEIEPGAGLSVAAEADSETAWFVRSGSAEYIVEDERIAAETSSVLFVPPGEGLQIHASGSEPLQLIRCQAVPQE